MSLMDDLFGKAQEGEMSESVKKYLKRWIIMTKRNLWQKFTIAPPEELIKIQAQAYTIDRLQKDLFVSKLKGEEAKEELKEMDESFAVFDNSK